MIALMILNVPDRIIDCFQNPTSHAYLRDIIKPATPPPGAKSQLTLNGEPTDALQVGS